MTMMFMVPKKFKKETLPQPDQSQIKLGRTLQTVAAISLLCIG
jgi:hypothetical protein